MPLPWGNIISPNTRVARWTRQARQATILCGPVDNLCLRLALTPALVFWAIRALSGTITPTCGELQRGPKGKNAMCGIVGYVGCQSAADFLLPGLRRLEYRGYDSSGVVTITPQKRFDLVKAAGRLERLVARLADSPVSGHVGLGHTRWATHGAATDENAHPHIGGNDEVAIVHNGVIENYSPLKERLESQGYRFRSATDSEVIAHLIAHYLERFSNNASPPAPAEMARQGYMPLTAAVAKTLSKLRGTY